MKTFVVDLTDVDEDELHEETANVLMFIVDRLHSGVNKELLGVALSEAMREYCEEKRIGPARYDTSARSSADARARNIT